jgi:uncharacterized small protein (DUF1192 family)
MNGVYRSEMESRVAILEREVEELKEKLESGPEIKEERNRS